MNWKKTMKKFLLTSVLLIPTAAYAFTGPQAAPTPPGYLTCGVIRHTDRDTDIKDAVFKTELIIKYNGSNVVSFDVLRHLSNGDVKDRDNSVMVRLDGMKKIELCGGKGLCGTSNYCNEGYP